MAKEFALPQRPPQGYNPDLIRRIEGAVHSDIKELAEAENWPKDVLESAHRYIITLVRPSDAPQKRYVEAELMMADLRSSMKYVDAQEKVRQAFARRVYQTLPLPGLRETWIADAMHEAAATCTKEYIEAQSLKPTA